jgi:hypothetical protein
MNERTIAEALIKARLVMGSRLLYREIENEIQNVFDVCPEVDLRKSLTQQQRA